LNGTVRSAASAAAGSGSGSGSTPTVSAASAARTASAAPAERRRWHHGLVPGCLAAGPLTEVVGVEGGESGLVAGAAPPFSSPAVGAAVAVRRFVSGFSRSRRGAAGMTDAGNTAMEYRGSEAPRSRSEDLATSIRSLLVKPLIRSSAASNPAAEPARSQPEPNGTHNVHLTSARPTQAMRRLRGPPGDSGWSTAASLSPSSTLGGWPRSMRATVDGLVCSLAASSARLSPSLARWSETRLP
jgi:hypothetical protein